MTRTVGTADTAVCGDGSRVHFSYSLASVDEHLTTVLNLVGIRR